MSAPAPEVDLPSGTPPAKGSRRWRRLLVVAGVAVLLLVSAAVVTGSLIVRRFDHAVSRATLLDPGTRVQAPPAVPHAPVVGPLNLLLLGSDYRVEDPENGQRSDTIIVAHVTRAMDHVYLVSIPRDLLVHIPAVPDLDFPGDYTKINAAFQFGHGGSGGSRLVSATVTSLTGVHFDGAVALDFSGLLRVVDLLDGVTICVDTPVVSIHSGRAFEVGCQRMTSAEVLDYLRQRDFPDGDFTRQRHQQHFLKSILDELLAAGTLTNPVRLDALLQAVAGSMTLDLGATTLPDLIFALSGLRSDDLTGLRVPSYVEMIGDTSYVIADDTAAELWRALREDSLAGWAQANPDRVNKI
jgi:LCP family protein required for cell wall assembly